MEKKCILGMISEINTLANERIKTEVKALNLPVLINHIPLFYLLPEDGSSIEFRVLREKWQISKSSLSDLLHKYESLGYVEKDMTCEDKRCVRIGLTKEALVIRAQFLEIEARILNTMVSSLDLEARDALETNIVTVLNNMKNNEK